MFALLCAISPLHLRETKKKKKKKKKGEMKIAVQVSNKNSQRESQTASNLQPKSAREVTRLMFSHDVICLWIPGPSS